MLAGEKAAVTPRGNPVTESATVAWNPLSSEVDTLTEVVPPMATFAAAPLVLMLKLGGGMVRVRETVFVTPPPVALTLG